MACRFCSTPFTIIWSSAIIVSKTDAFSPSIGKAVAFANCRMVVRSRLRMAVSCKIIWAVFCAVVGLLVVIVCPFEKSVQFGTANPGQPIGGTENAAGGRVTDNNDAGLIPHRQFKPVTGKAGTEVVAIGARRPCCPNMLAGLSEIDAMAFPGLMGFDAIGRNRLPPMTQNVGQAVGKIAMAFAAQCGQDGDIVGTGNQWVTEFQFENTRHLFVARVAELARQNLAGGRVGLGHDEMPVTVSHTGNSTRLLVFDHHCHVRIEAEFRAQRPCGSLELPAVYGDFGRDDEMAQGVNPVELSCVGNSVMKVRYGATDYDDCLVLFALCEMPGQRRGSRRRPNAGSLDEHPLSPQQCLGVGAGLTEIGGDTGVSRETQAALDGVDATAKSRNGNSIVLAQRLGQARIGSQGTAQEFRYRDAPALGHGLGSMLFPFGKAHLEPLIA